MSSRRVGRLPLWACPIAFFALACEDPQVPWDNPLTVAYLPLAGLDDVSRSVLPAIFFSASVDPASVDGASVTLETAVVERLAEGGFRCTPPWAPVAGLPEVDPGNPNVVRFRPDALLAAEACFRFCCATAVRGTEAGPLLDLGLPDQPGIGAQQEFATGTAAAPARATQDLLVLYTFEEGSGTQVHDVSGVGAALDLTIGDAAVVDWIAGGLKVKTATILQSAAAATKITAACKVSNALTVEAWLAPVATNQDGHVVTVSADFNNRNFSLRQRPESYDVFLRTSSTDSKGHGSGTWLTPPETTLTHFVYTRGADGKIAVYVNGEANNEDSVAGDFSTWNDGYKLAIAHEFDTDPVAEPWLGDLYLVAIYGRALTATEVLGNFLAGD